MHLNWFNPGGRDPSSDTLIMKGFQNNIRKNASIDEIHEGDQSIQKHLYLNNRQYVGRYNR